MSSLNKVMLIGRLGKDPEVRYTQGGNPVATFSVATSERWKDNCGNPQEKTSWHNIVMWNKLAEVAKRFLSKGALVYLEGKLITRKWQDQSGANRYTTEVVCNKMVMLGGKRNAEAEEAPSEESEAAEPVGSSEATGIDGSDIPF
ncbi:MAG: single-stranded DNA-binding protein [Acidobacteriia bacterium]|nr:single-stranded DNA-binding protein [Terriglobia bacterium]